MIIAALRFRSFLVSLVGALSLAGEFLFFFPSAFLFSPSTSENDSFSTFFSSPRSVFLDAPLGWGTCPPPSPFDSIPLERFLLLSAPLVACLLFFSPISLPLLSASSTLSCRFLSSNSFFFFAATICRVRSTISDNSRVVRVGRTLILRFRSELLCTFSNARLYEA